MDEHLKRGLQKIYRFLIQYDILVFVVLISLVFCIIADGAPELRMYKTLRDDFAKQCPVEYVWLWERLCGPQIDYAAISAFILAVWAASLSLIGLFLGRAESRLYGIKVMDIFLENYSYTKVFLLLLTFVAELIAAMLAIMYEWEMTLIVSAMLQVLILIYILLMVFIENSVSNVEGVIKELAWEAIKREKEEEFVVSG